MERKGWKLAFVTGLLVAALGGTARAETALLYARGNVLVGANFNDGTGSSDMTLILQLSADGKALADEGHAIKYIVPTAAIPNFHKPDFDDSGWKEGVSGIGFDDKDDNTELTRGIALIYTRYRFEVSDPKAVKSLVLLADYDDGFVAWLNGVEIARSPTMAAGGSKPGDIPSWDYSVAGGKVGNHEASRVPAGKPNAARWADAKVEKFEVQFTAVSATAVNLRGKLAATWASLKAPF